ncbi:hypothetical protein CPT_Mater25 [Bacillus phage Mater]|uniref:Uncharacterized protein n=1 Tax=Bacillus phage Mater TaxID=1540090 RepID=A0A0A0RMJ2_9CAUD|nr:hypothetical protein CPT_Mater25 [Bacillus phage Mater]AIW03182.1 hypothetical protein CPT_Mater25 [Bacillus phage Mater]
MTRYDFSGNPIPEEPLHKRLLWQQIDYQGAIHAWGQEDTHIKSEHPETGHVCFHPSYNALFIGKHEIQEHMWFIDVTDRPTVAEMVHQHLNPKEEKEMPKNQEFIDRIVELTKEAGSKEEAVLKVMSFLSAEYYVIDADVVDDPDNYLYERDIFHFDNFTEYNLESAFERLEE